MPPNNRVTQRQHFEALLFIQREQAELKVLVLENRTAAERQFGELKAGLEGTRTAQDALQGLYRDQRGMWETQAGRIDRLQASDRKVGFWAGLVGVVSAAISGLIASRQ